MKRQPAFMRLTADEYDLLIGCVACYGYSLGRIPGFPRYQTYRRWCKRAMRGEEPYASWVPMFARDVNRIRREINERLGR